MADVESNIHVNIDTSDALASLKLLQRQISAFHTQMAKSGTAASAVAANQAQNLMNSINATGQFQASMRTVTSSTESFTNALERNKLTSREYFRYTGAATRTFGKLFKSEFETINKVARERVKDIQTQYVKLGRGANGALQAIAVRPLTLDMKNLGTQTAIAAQRQQLLNQLLKQGSTNLLNFGKNTQWAGRQLMVGFTVPLAMLGTTAAKTFMKLEEQAIRFKRVYGEMFTTQAETDAMVKQVQKLATEYTKYGVAIEDTMKMAADAAAMGKQGAELLAQISQATRLAVLGGVDQAQALETTISVTNAFGVAADQLAGKIDFLNAVENQTVVSIEDLTTAIPKAGPVVKQLGGSVEDLAFFLTAMKEGGINASEGANALKSGLASLINPSAKASAFLGDLGVNIRGIVEANKGDIKATVVGFAQALDTLDPLNRARAIEQLFGKFQFSRLSTLFQNVTAQGTQANRVLQLTQATTEELAILSQRELDKIQNTTTYKFKKSMENLKLAIAPVGEQFLKALTPIVEFVGKILDKFNNLGEGSKKFLTIFTVAVAGVGPILLMTFGLIANAVANIIKMFAGMKSMYNRTGGASKVLGEQTNYLTKEQLEASAVSASLDQVHQKLQQTFTSEAGALNNLANAYRRAIAAQMGFTGPVPGGRGSQARKKYSTGTTRVPGSGNQDTVPSMLTPGEAVIPAEVAQDPRFKPIISAMVSKRLQGFNDGTGEVTQSGKAKSKVKSKPDTVFAHATGNSKVDLSDVPDEFKEKAQTLKVRGFEKGTTYTAVGFDIPESLHKDLTHNRANLVEYLEEIKKTRSVQTMTSKLMGPPSNMSPTKAAQVADQIRTNLIKSLEAIPRVPLGDGSHSIPLIGDKDVYSRMGNIKSGILGGLARDPKHAEGVSALLAPQGLTSFQKPKMVYNSTATAKELYEAVEKSKSKPNTKASAKRLFDHYPGQVVKVSRDAKGNIIAYERPEVSARTNELKKTMNNAVLEDGAFKGGRSDGSSGTIKVASVSGKRSQAALLALQKLEDAKTAGKPITKYREQLSVGTGFSNVGAKHLSGVHITEDGRKVYVKPMIDEKSAMAELRATRIAREVHGLETPKQELRLIQDPVTGKTIYALESEFNSKFDPDTIPKKFSKKQYIKQLLAAGLRGDKDLKRGNLGGNVLTDVGTAGVFKTASGARDYADKMPSLEEMIKTNLSGVKGPAAARSPFWFGNQTADIAKKMSAEQFESMMQKEVKKSITNLEKLIPKLQLNDAERPLYTSMLDRLKEKVDWKAIHKLHTSIAIKPDEVLQDDKTGKITKPKTEKLPAKVKSSAGKKDTLMTQEPKGKSIVQGIPKKVGRFVMPGKANAPEARVTTSTALIDGARGSIAEAKAVGANIGTNISQSAAAASRTLLYGTGPVDAEAKSIRRQLEKQERVKAKTQARINANKTAMYGTTGTIDPVMRGKRKQAELAEKRSRLAEKIGYQQQIISERAAAQAKSKTVSGRITAFASKRADARQAKIDAGKRPGMGIGGAVGIASGAAMIGSMAPGKVGEISQKVMMPLMGLSMIIPMLKSPASALAIGLIATVGSFVALRMAFDSAQQKVLDESDKFRGSANAIQAIANFSGKATASEQMDLRRKNSFSMLGPATGKTTYGEAFVQTAEGKALTKRIAEQNSAGKGNVAAKDLSGQLSASIMSGAIDMGQAKSLAMNAAREAGDMSIGIKVIGQLESLLGPNGERLDKEPLKVRLDMVAQNSKAMQSSINSVKGAGLTTQLAGQKTMQKVGIGASALGGAAAGAGIGGMIGGALGAVGGPLAVITAGIGATIGAGIGAAVGGIGAYFASKKFTKQAGTLGAAAAVDAKIAMEQNKQMLDSFDMYYQKKVEELRLQGKINEADALQTKYLKERDKLTAAQGKLQADVVSQYEGAGGLQESMMSGMKKAATARYKDDPNQLAYLDVVNQQAGDLRSGGLISKGQEYLIQAKMASGDIPPAVFRTLLGLAADNKDIAPKMMNIITKFSGATSESIGVAAQNILGADDVVNKEVQTKFVTRVEAFEKDSDALDFTKNMIKLNNLNAVIPSDVMVSYYVDPKNQAAYDNLNKILDTIEGSKDLTAKIVYEIMPEVKGTAAFDEAYFNTLTEDQQKVYTTTIASLINIPDPTIIESEDFKAWRKETGPKGGAGVTGSKAYIVDKYIEAQGNKAVTDGVAIDTKAPTGTTPTGGGSKVQSSPLDDLVKKLRDVRKNQIKVTEGWSASRKALDNLFGGKKTIDVFSGIENDLRGLGGSQDFIELIVGMDPKEYEKRKNSLFKFDNKGNIIGLKADAKNIQEALNSITMGEWNSSMESETKAISDQSKAMDKLSKLGVPVADAYELVSNKAYAQAIANGVNEKSLGKLITKYNALTVAQKASASIQDAKTATSQLKNDRLQEQRLKQMAAGGNGLNAFAISSDNELKALEVSIFNQNNNLARLKAKLLATKGVDAKKAVQKDIDAAEIILAESNDAMKSRLEELKKTVGLYEDLFNDLFSNVMDSFDTEERKIQIDFEMNIDNKKANAEIEKAQNEIAAMQYLNDDKEAALKAIEDQEQAINEKYDKRIEALDAVEKANANIANQQKGQLTLAEALTSGDIAAAARAAQEIRAQEAADAVTKQKDAIEQSRKYELSTATGFDKQGQKDPKLGQLKTRKQLEKEIKEIQDKIFEKEESAIEPQQEFLRLKQITLKEDIAGIRIAGLSREAWEQIQSNVEIARVRALDFVTGIESAMKALDQGLTDLSKFQAKDLIAKYGVQTQPVNTAAADRAAAEAAAKAAADKAAADAAAKAAADKAAADAAAKAAAEKAAAEGKSAAEQAAAAEAARKAAEAKAKAEAEARAAAEAAAKAAAEKAATEKAAAEAAAKAAADAAAAAVDNASDSPSYSVIPKTATTYVVKPGDTLSGIASQNGISLEELLDANPKFTTDPKYKGGSMIWSGTTVKIPGGGSGGGSGGGFGMQMAAMGGLINPMKFALGGFAKGTDTVPAMLTPGEFVMSKYAVDAHGVNTMKAINSGQPTGGAVYNNTYTLTVNAKTNANPNEIAQAVMSTIKQVDDRRIRGIGINGR